MAVSDFPKVVEIESVTDAGDFGSDSCPHCGAPCRYVTHFYCEDGSYRGAARVCFSLFPKSKYAARVEKILIKERDGKRTGRKIASWDREVIGAIRLMTTLGAPAVDEIIRQADLAKHNYIASRYGRR
jgi:hypothetical protein